MFRKSVRRAGLATLAAALVVAIPTAQAHAEGGIGAVDGHFRTAGGQPIVNANVVVYDGSLFVGQALTDNSGAYSIPNIPAGAYTIRFYRDNLIEWAPGVRTQGDATPVAVTDGGTVTVDEQALPTGTIAGTILNPDGTPATIGVIAEGADGAFQWSGTDADGHYQATVFSGQSYMVAMVLSNSGLIQYAPSQPDRATAGFYPVTADHTTVVNDSTLPTAIIAGQYTDEVGNPDGNTMVNVELADGTVVNYANTRWDGRWSTDVFGDQDYIVRFDSQTAGTQYAYRAAARAAATLVHVPAGGVTTVDDQHIGPATGSISVTAKDSVTGAAVTGFCAYAGAQSACTHTGTALLDGVTVGSQSVSVYPNNIKYLTPDPVDVTVEEAQTTAVTVTLKEGATIKAAIVDAVTGAPVEGACVVAFTPGVTVWGDGFGPCSGPDGIVRLPQLKAGSYSMYVTPPDGSAYGAQWVGKTRGQGTESGARLVTAVEGKTVTTGDIKLDLAGTVTGVVTGVNSHGPLAGALVGPQPITVGLGSLGHDVVTDATGRYTITDLGPYAWPLFAEHDGYPKQWSGGVGNRYTATTVTVVAGSSVTFDLNLKKGTTLGGTALTSDGNPIADGGRIIAYNATTGDEMGFADTDGNGNWSMPIIPGQNVKLGYYFSSSDGTVYNGWYGTPATSLKVTSPGQSNIAIILLPSS